MRLRTSTPCSSAPTPSSAGTTHPDGRQSGELTAYSLTFREVVVFSQVRAAPVLHIAQSWADRTGLWASRPRKQRVERHSTLSRLTPFFGYGSTMIVQVQVPGSLSLSVREPSRFSSVGVGFGGFPTGGSQSIVDAVPPFTCESIDTVVLVSGVLLKLACALSVSGLVVQLASVVTETMRDVPGASA
jgi:hypothetical protein